MMRAKLVWDVDPQTKALRISNAIKNKAMRIALNAGASPVKAAVMSSAPKEEGHLAASTKIKVKNYKSNNTWVAIVGAGSKYKRATRTTSRKTGKSGIKKRIDKKTGKKVTVYIRPAIYQAFVDRGTKHMSGRHYLRAAFYSAIAQFHARTKAKLREVLEAEMRKK